MLTNEPRKSRLLDTSIIETVKRPLNWYDPLPGQVPVIKALYDGFRFILLVTPRRYGKDLTCLALLVQKMWEVPGNYYYVFPRFKMGREAIWDNMTNDGKPYLSLFPEDLIMNINHNQMFIRMRNSKGTFSTFKVVGMNDPKGIPGKNVHGMVLSEYKYFNPYSFQLLIPIFRGNPQCWCIVNSTPYGRGNHLWDLKVSAEKYKDWFYWYLTLDDTNHISKEEIEEDIKNGIISRDMAMQEYWCSWDLGIDGSYYGKYIDAMEIEGRAGFMPYDSTLPVYTVCDIGRMRTVIGYFQLVEPMQLNIINCDYIQRGGIEDTARAILGKPYVYEKDSHWYPHDMRVADYGARLTRIEKAETLGIGGKIVPDISIQDGIECVRTVLHRTYVDKIKCADLLRALKNHRHIFDYAKQVYTIEPVKDWTRDWADMMRYMAIMTLKLEKEKKVMAIDTEKAYRTSEQILYEGYR